MKNLRILLVATAFLFALVAPALAQDVVAPADSDDLNAFDQELTKTQRKTRIRVITQRISISIRKRRC